MIFQKVMHSLFLGNTVEDYAVSLGIFIGLLLIIGIMKLVFLARLKGLPRKDGTLFLFRLAGQLERNAVPLLVLIALYAALQHLRLSGTIDKILHAGIVFVPIFFIVKFILSLVAFGIEQRWKRTEVTASDRQSLRIMSIVIEVIVWVTAGIVLFDNLGIKISTLVAGLGIGGIAVALASQTVLGDLFAFIMILFDRPFEVGDFIIVNDFMGTVSEIGIKSTRLRSLDGELIVFHNTDLTNARIRNYKKMKERRVLFTLGISCDTQLPEMKKVPGIIAGIIRSIPETRFDRAHFKAFGDVSLVYEVVYYVLTPDYNVYMDIQQAINYRIHEELDALNIKFASPVAVVTPALLNAKK
jgi:small-conductance mechanosensitive channel